MMHRKASVYSSDEAPIAPKPAPSTAMQPLEMDLDEGRVPASATNKAFWAWVLLAFSYGPVQKMVSEYITAALQSVANAVGHVPGSDKPCAKKGSIACVVQLGGSEVDYLSYMLYIKAISRAIEGIVSVIAASYADFSNYRKLLYVGCIAVSAILALPFVGLAGRDYDHLNALAVMFILLEVISGINHVVSHSYLPIFMKTSGLGERRKKRNATNTTTANKTTDGKALNVKRGNKINVFGFVAGNLGSLLALSIAIIISYTRQVDSKDKYTNYLLTTTIGGAITLVTVIPGAFLLPQIPGEPIPAGQSIWSIPFRIWGRLLSSFRSYPDAFKLCTGWVLWTIGMHGYEQISKSLFLETTGISEGSGLYTVYSFLTVIYTVLGSFLWLFISRKQAQPKRWAVGFLLVQAFCILWGTLGISEDVAIGYKTEAEFWIFEIFMTCSTGALRSINPVMLATIIPEGSEAAFYGLHNLIDLATSWANPLIQGAIQDQTHNLRYSLVQNFVLLLAAVATFTTINLERGQRDAQRPLNGVKAKADDGSWSD